MVDNFYADFAHYLDDGEAASLANYLDEDADPAFAAVYRNGSWRALTAALEANFPTVTAVIGADYFGVVARHYIDVHPPVQGTLVGYGQLLPDFLLQQQEQHGLPYLHDLAALDAAWLVAYFSASGTPLTQDDLASLISGEQDVTSLRLELAPHVSLVGLDHDVCEGWELLKRQGSLVEIIEFQRQQNHGLVWRFDDLVHVRALQAGEVSFLAAIEQGANLGSASQSGLAVDANFDVAELFGSLIHNQILQKG